MNAHEPHRQPGPPVLPPLLDLSSIWKGKLYVLASIAAALALGGGYLRQATAVFEVDSSLLVHNARLAVEQGKLVPDDPNFLATQVEIIGSPRILRPSIEEAGIAPEGEAGQAGALAEVVRALDVSQVKGTNVISISYRTPDETQGVRLVGAIVGRYQKFSDEMQGKPYADTLRLLAGREEGLRKELHRLQQQYEQLRHETPLVGEQQQALDVHLVHLRELGTKLTEARDRRMSLEIQPLSALPPEARYGFARASTSPAPAAGQPEFVALAARAGIENLLDDMPLREAVKTPHPEGSDPMLRDRAGIEAALHAARVRVKHLQVRFGPKHDELQAAEEEVAGWTEILRKWDEAARFLQNQELDAAGRLIQRELEAARQTEAELTAAYETQFQTVKALDVYLVKEKRAVENIVRVRAMHEQTLQQLSESELINKALANGQSSLRVQVINEPKATGIAAWPRPLLLLAGCGLIGLAVGCLIASSLNRSRRIDSSPVG